MPPFCGEDDEAVFGNRRVERSALFLPVRDQFVQRARVHHRAGEDVRADLGAFLDQADVDVCVELFEPYRRSKASRAAADDEHIEFHGFALHAVFLWFCILVL